MSNCITIDNPTVRFNPGVLDDQALSGLLNSASENITLKNCTNEELDADERMAWWFLCENTMTFKNGTVVINLGRGRSSHTWRDFKGTLQILSRFVKKDFHYTFQIRDEVDDFDQAENYRIDLRVKDT